MLGVTQRELRAVLPAIPPVVPQNVPDILKREKRWLAWRAGPLKPTGKFDKFPVDPKTGRKINPVDPGNWLPFEAALTAHQQGIASGIGFALSNQHPLVTSAGPAYLTAIDLDHCLGTMNQQKALWRELGAPYVEFSPSQQGLRMLGLTSTALKGGNAGGGRELYSSGRFMTITGIGSKGTLRDITAELSVVERRWFPAKPALATPPVCLTTSLIPETREQGARVLSMLDAVSADTTYEIWRDIIWSIASTGWASSRPIAHLWSQKALHRYDGPALDKLVDDYDPARGITLGTLAYHARQNGWTDKPGLKPQAQQALPPATQQARGRLMTADQLRQLPAAPYVVRSVFPAQGLAAIYGEPGCGKSFLALHLAHAISTGAADWFGFRVRQRPVAYVALEGWGGMGKRTAALEVHSGQPCPSGLRFWDQDIHLLTGDGIELLASEVVSTVGTGAVVIVDTLNQASPGADENTSQDMGKIIANSKRLAAAVGGLAILVHHSGKTRAQGLRGHSSLLAAMDAVIEVATVEGKHKTWSITKAKDDSSDVKRDFDLITYTVDQDEDGGPLTSCAVQHALQARPPTRVRPTGKNQKAALTELQRLLPIPGQSIDYKAALDRVAAILTVAKPKDRAKEAVDALIRGNHLILTAGALTLA